LGKAEMSNTVEVSDTTMLHKVMLLVTKNVFVLSRFAKSVKRLFNIFQSIG
jgi:hypothetical protein